MSESSETVTELTAESTGVWLVTTQGTTHIWDMDDGTYERRPGPMTRAGAFVGDGSPHRIRVVHAYPLVGRGFWVVFDHPLDPQCADMFVVSSVVASIQRIG